MSMNFIEVKLHDLDNIFAIANMHYNAYHEKFCKDRISDDFNDYIMNTIDDIYKYKVITNAYGLVVLQDMTDKLLLNSTYHLVRRIYVKPNYRGQGIAKQFIKYCQDTYGTIMGYDGKFYNLEKQK